MNVRIRSRISIQSPTKAREFRSNRNIFGISKMSKSKTTADQGAHAPPDQLALLMEQFQLQMQKLSGIESMAQEFRAMKDAQKTLAEQLASQQRQDQQQQLACRYRDRPTDAR